MDTDRGSYRLAALLTAIVAVHLGISLWHGAAHIEVPVPLGLLQQAFIAIVIGLLPVVGAALLWTRRKRGGALLIAAAMLASLVFGVVNHYVLDSPDNVVSIPEHAWRHTFVISAALIVVSESFGTAIAAVAAWAWVRAA